MACLLIINFNYFFSVVRQTVRPGTPPDFVLRVSVVFCLSPDFMKDFPQDIHGSPSKLKLLCKCVQANTTM